MTILAGKYEYGVRALSRSEASVIRCGLEHASRAPPMQASSRGAGRRRRHCGARERMGATWLRYNGEGRVGEDGDGICRERNEKRYDHCAEALPPSGDGTAMTPRQTLRPSARAHRPLGPHRRRRLILGSADIYGLVDTKPGDPDVHEAIEPASSSGQCVGVQRGREREAHGKAARGRDGVRRLPHVKLARTGRERLPQCAARGFVGVRTGLYGLGQITKSLLHEPERQFIRVELRTHARGKARASALIGFTDTRSRTCT